jgi:hypothetical protein
MEAFGIIGGIISLIALIVFFVMASNINAMKKNIHQWGDYFSKQFEGIYTCSHCGFTTKIKHDFCPVCKNGNIGKTLEELQENYKKTSKQEQTKE